MRYSDQSFLDSIELHLDVVMRILGLFPLFPTGLRLACMTQTLRFDQLMKVERGIEWLDLVVLIAIAIAP